MFLLIIKRKFKLIKILENRIYKTITISKIKYLIKRWQTVDDQHKTNGEGPMGAQKPGKLHESNQLKKFVKS